MYDSVWIECPKCERSIETQSKAGECILRDYYNQAPPEIAASINGDVIYCERCQKSYRVMALQSRMVDVVAVPLHASTSPYNFDKNDVFEKDYRN